MSKYETPKINVNVGAAKAIALIIIALFVIGVIAAAAVTIVDAGHRGILLHWNAVDLTIAPLDEGLHFVVPFCRLCSTDGSQDTEDHKINFFGF